MRAMPGCSQLLAKPCEACGELVRGKCTVGRQHLHKLCNEAETDQ